jgi:Uma2 family endonuclease
MVTRYRATIEEYLRTPQEPPYLEYVDGEIVQKAMPDWFHGLIVKYLMQNFIAYEWRAGGRSAPEIRVRFLSQRGPEYRLPDYAYWTPGRPHREGRFGLPPTVAIEVRSPEESMGDQRAKCRYFREHGVDAAWLVDPESRTVEVFEEGREGVVLREDATLTSPVLPDFELPLRELFAVLDEE